MSSPPLKTHILLIGAGTTSLLLAQSLQKSHTPFRLTERFPSPAYHAAQREWGMTLHWGSDPIRSVLPSPLFSRIKEIWVDPTFSIPDFLQRQVQQGGKGEWTVPMYRGDTGEWLFELGDEGTMRVSRAKMRRLFSEGVDVHYDQKLLEIEDLGPGRGVKAVFGDGTQVEADLVVGCDGAKSRVREILVGQERAGRTDMNIWLVNFPCRFSRRTALMLRDFHPVYQVSYHPDGHVGWVSLMDGSLTEDDPESWSFQVMFSWTGAGPTKEELPTQKDRTEFIRGMAGKFAEPWKSVYAEIPDGLEFGVDRISWWKPFDWSEVAGSLAGKVTLAGDAAHVIPPFRGQGLNNALLDAAELSEELVKEEGNGFEGQRRAVKAYEDKMRERMLTELPLSMDASLFAHNFEMIMQSPAVKIGVQKPKAERQDTPVESK